MKKYFLIFILVFSTYTFSQENLLHTGEATVYVVNYPVAWDVTFTATAVSERWGKSVSLTEQYYNPTDDYESASVTPDYDRAFFDVVVDRTAGDNPTLGLGNYKISAFENGIEKAYFYMDWRTSGYSDCPDISFDYDFNNKNFLYHNDSQIIDGTQQTSWGLNSNTLYETSGLGLYTTQTTNQYSNPSLSWNAYNGTALGYYIHKTLTCESGTITNQYFTTSTSWTDNDFTITNPRFANAQAEYWITAKLSETEQSAGANHTFASGQSSIQWKINSKSDEVVLSYKLNQNYPNPFNPTTAISYELKNSGLVSLKVYSVLGKIVVDLVNETQEAGQHEISFNATNLPSGTYIYKIQSGNFVQVRKMVLLK